MRHLGTISNVAVITVAVIVGAGNLYDRFGPREPRGQTTLAKQLMGKPLPLAKNVVSGRNGTVILFLSKNCHFCTDSMGLYQRLADLRSASSRDIKLVVVGPQEREALEEVKVYLAGHNLTPDGVQMADFAQLSIFATPTLVLQGASGLVSGVWVGKLSREKEDEVLSKVRALGGT
jgi:hypothetical protein